MKNSITRREYFSVGRFTEGVAETVLTRRVWLFPKAMSGVLSFLGAGVVVRALYGKQTNRAVCAGSLISMSGFTAGPVQQGRGYVGD
ncbi:MAG TPA: hypothetical protein VLG74_15935, partial [Blastocatellia bacterium]|nr:hypothetical protein [Blastocatellia bacterium]